MIRKLLALLAPLVLAVVLAVCFAYAEEVTGPTVVGGNVTRPPVTVGGVAYPSPNASPVSQGKADRIATDGSGNMWVRVTGPVATTATLSAGNIGVTSNTGGGSVNVTDGSGPLTVDGTVATTLAAGNVSIVGPLPAGSPVGTVASLPVTLTGFTSAASTSLTTTVSTTNVTVISSSTRGWILTNNGSVDCYVTFGASAASGASAQANGGHLLAANGGRLGADMVGGYTGAITLITASGSTVVASSTW